MRADQPRRVRAPDDRSRAARSASHSRTPTGPRRACSMCELHGRSLADGSRPARLTAPPARCNPASTALLGRRLDRATRPGQAGPGQWTSMTYHAELAPRRRPWLIAMPLVIVLLLGAVWSGVWYYAAGEAETRMNDWQAQQAKAGRVFACGTQTVGGFPFRIEVRCDERGGGTEGHAAAARDQAEGDPGGRAGVGPEAADRGVHRAADRVRARASRPCTRHLDARAGERARNAGHAGARLDRGRRAQARGRRRRAMPLFDSKRAEFHARVQFGSWPHNPAIDLAVKLDGATAPTRPRR